MTEFDNNLPAKQESGMITIESSRAIEEVQGSLVIAKRFPRDENEAYLKIMKSCERTSLAEKATYFYKKGGTPITGPSIRLAEVLARCWGNLDYGVRELSQGDGESEVEAYCWDKESNTRQVKTFRVAHKMKARGSFKTLTDPRDIYEHVANQGARRVRACILGIIPGDIVDAAIAKCDATLKGNSDIPIADRIKVMLERVDKLGISKEMIEERLGHNVSAIVETQLVDLFKICNSLKDGMSKREDWFKMPQASAESDELTDKIKGDDKPEDDSTETVEVPEDIDSELEDDSKDNFD